MIWTLAAAAILGVAITAVIARLGNAVGDASIYWVFADSAWEHGPFHYGADGPKHGATSPLWALILMLARPLAGDNFLVYQVLGGAAFFLVAVATYRLTLFTCKSVPLALGAAAFLLFSRPLGFASTHAFETPLFAALLVETVLSTLKLHAAPARPGRIPRELVRWALFGALLPLARPEGALAVMLLAPWVLGHVRGNLRATALVGAMAVPAGAYFGAMYLATGQLLPSSVAARQLLAGAGDVVPKSALTIVASSAGLLFESKGWLYVCSNILQAALMAAGCWMLWKRKPVWAVALVSIPALYAALLLWKNPGFLHERYSAPLAPLGLTLAAAGLQPLLRPWPAVASSLAKAMSPAIVLLLLPIVFALHVHQCLTTSFRPPKRSALDVLDFDGARTLEPRLQPTDLALVYEIQSQLYLGCRTISADGVVGGEILPYLRSKDLAGFLREFSVTHVFVSQAFALRGIYRDTLLERLARAAEDQHVGDEYVEDGLRFTRIAERAAKPSIRVPHWTSVYRVEQSAAPMTIAHGPFGAE